jgi:hypothetical protein
VSALSACGHQPRARAHPAHVLEEFTVMLLADEFFFLSHDDSTGRARLHGTAVGLGLAAALLAELVLEKRIAVRDGQLAVLDGTPPRDALAHATLDQITAEPQSHPLRTWLVFLGQTAREAVGDRLWRAGLVHRETSRRLFRQSLVYPPVDPHRAARTAARLSTRVRLGEPLDLLDVFLVGLAIATGLDQTLLEAAGPNGYQYARRLAAGLPPPLRDLLGQTEAAVGDAVLSHRT